MINAAKTITAGTPAAWCVLPVSFARATLLAVAGMLLAAGARAGPTAPVVLDDFRDHSAWKASASDQVKARLRADRDGSLCMDVDFAGVSGYAVMHRELPQEWPAAFDLVARVKGGGAVGDIQVKLVDASGDNVWWINRPNHALPRALSDLKLRRRHIEFAWGPATDRTLRRTQFVEFVIAAGRETAAGGGKSTLCVARLTLAGRAPDPSPWPAAVVTDRPGAIDIDFGQVREFNGLALRWPAPAGGRLLDYDVFAADGTLRWRLIRRVRGSDGGLDALYLPESEARYIRVKLPHDMARPEVALRSAAQWPDVNAVLAEIGRDATRGDLPRAFRGEQNYWSLIGVDGGGELSALMSEDGALEVGRGGYSVEPAVAVGELAPVTWAHVAATQQLRDGYLPIPNVHWQHAEFTLDIEAAADGPRDAPDLLARYVLRNTGAETRTFTLLLAVRPWQVNPPQQFLATRGGASPLRTLRWSGAGLAVNGRAPLWPTAAPHRVSALAFDGGQSLAALRAAPALGNLRDPQALASAALQFRITLPPGAVHTFGWVAPLGAHRHRAGASSVDARIDGVAAQWRTRLNRVRLVLPEGAQRIADTLRTSLAHILMSRSGPSLRPGTRSYARSWMRDGAMMVDALVRLGETAVAREFVDWFAGYIFASGSVPCCVDGRGADPVPENDSHGQYLYAVAELWRHTHDRAFLDRHWPRVQRVVAHMESLRQRERVAANRAPERSHLFGLMPPSISHEGYSDKPAYSYWDDFWALRGYKDAALMAQALGHEQEAATWRGWRDEFTRELSASIASTAVRYRLATIAGAADRGDFDATSTTVALNPAQAQDMLPPRLLAGTFEQYWQESQTRARGLRNWKDYTPYELRTVGALVRLGESARAHAMLRFFFNDQRPQGWNQWAEVVMREVRETHFLGDMPHAWVSSDYIRSALDLFGYGREQDESYVIGAGLSAEWLVAGGIDIDGVSTPYGSLAYRIVPTGQGWSLHLSRPLTGLAGGVVLAWPGDGALPTAVFGGRTLAWQGRELRLPDAPCQIDLIVH